MNPRPNSPLLTDAYAFSMAQCYLEFGMTGTAVFEFFVRDLPAERGFLVAAGLEQVLDFLETFRFAQDELEWLRQTGSYSDALLDYLGRIRFSGDVDAMPEGTIFFSNEPVLRVIAPLPVAQLLEARIINLIHFQTLVASKAARHVLAAPGKSLLDFGLRRAHGSEAGLLAARAAYLAGFHGTSNVAAARCFQIPVKGTMAHSFIQAHDSEQLAFQHFTTTFPENTVLLLDTYDAVAAARKLASLEPELRKAIVAVRLDSGDLAAQARSVRAILDENGLSHVKIFASGGLDELAIRNLLSVNAPIDGFGVGTSLVTSADAPYLDCAYKLQEYAGRGCRKRSPGKSTLPGRKQVYRFSDAQGFYCRDTLTLLDDAVDMRERPHPLLIPILRSGRRMRPPEALSAIRTRTLGHLERLPRHLRELKTLPEYPVRISPALLELAEKVDRAANRGPS